MYPCMLIWGNTPSTTSAWLIWLVFPSHPLSQFSCITFYGHENKGENVATIRRIWYPTSLIPQYCALPPPPCLPIIFCQDNHHAIPAPFHVTMRRCRNFYLVLHKYFLCTLTLFFLHYCRDLYRKFHHLKYMLCALWYNILIVITSEQELYNRILIRV